jgi:hypothetical protein
VDAGVVDAMRKVKVSSLKLNKTINRLTELQMTIWYNQDDWRAVAEIAVRDRGADIVK